MERTNITTPVGRLVAGSPYKGSDKDAEGRPLVVKNGPDAGKPRLDFYFAVAIPKGAERHWAETEWGAKIWATGHQFLPHAGQMPTFAWKITDGDSTIPNKKGKKPAEREGYKGCWVLGFSSGYAPDCYTLVGQAKPTLLQGENGINLGDYVQVNGSVAGNGSTSQPGVYLNHNMLCLIGYGQRIVVGPDVDSAGFGGALPPGASLTPPGGFVPPVASTPQPAAAAPVPSYQPPSVPASVQPMAPVAAPYTGYMAVTPPPVAPSGPQMTAKAQGTREQYHAVGWSDAQLIAEGLMTA